MSFIIRETIRSTNVPFGLDWIAYHDRRQALSGSLVDGETLPFAPDYSSNLFILISIFKL